MERWKPIKGYEGEILVSDQGRVMNNRGLVLRTTRDAQNNLVVSCKGKHVRIAYAVAHAFVPNPLHLQYQGYKDGNKDNCCADNIEWIEPNFENDSLPKTITLIRNGEVIEFASISAASKYLHCEPNRLKKAANNKEKNMKVYGYSVAWSDETERIERLANGGFGSVIDLDGEEWRDLPELQGEYQVSNLGRIKRTKGMQRLRKVTQQKNGYMYVSLTFQNKPKCFKVSRLVAKAFIPNPNGYEEVDHINRDKTNNTVTNLEWVTQEENIRRYYAWRKEHTRGGDFSDKLKTPKPTTPPFR